MVKLVSSGRQGTNFETKIFKFRCFFGPSDRNKLYHTPLLSKMWGSGKRIFFRRIPLRSSSSASSLPSTSSSQSSSSPSSLLVSLKKRFFRLWMYLWRVEVFKLLSPSWFQFWKWNFVIKVLIDILHQISDSGEPAWHPRLRWGLDQNNHHQIDTGDYFLISLSFFSQWMNEFSSDTIFLFSS